MSDSPYDPEHSMYRLRTPSPARDYGESSASIKGSKEKAHLMDTIRKLQEENEKHKERMWAEREESMKLRATMMTLDDEKHEAEALSSHYRTMVERIRDEKYELMDELKQEQIEHTATKESLAWIEQKKKEEKWGFKMELNRIERELKEAQQLGPLMFPHRIEELRAQIRRAHSNLN